VLSVVLENFYVIRGDFFNHESHELTRIIVVPRKSLESWELIMFNYELTRIIVISRKSLESWGFCSPNTICNVPHGKARAEQVLSVKSVESA
jgi:hypothetical protein